jgi:hypothetical protein
VTRGDAVTNKEPAKNVGEQGNATWRFITMEHNDSKSQEPQHTATGTQTPEGHDRAYHLKKADGSSDHHIPLIKSLLARPDVTLHEALVYGLLLDKLGPGHIYCCPTHGEIADTLKIGVRSVERAMANLKAKGLVATVFAGDRDRYYLPDRGICSLGGQR